MIVVDFIAVGVAWVEAPWDVVGFLVGATDWLPTTAFGLTLLLVYAEEAAVVFLVVAQGAGLGED